MPRTLSVPEARGPPPPVRCADRPLRGPVANRKPSGPITFASVITAFITFGRSGAGVPTVMTAIIGALTNGAQKPNVEASRRGDELLAALRDEGRLREDVDLETTIVFVNIVANGLALAVSLGLELDVDGLLRLLHGGIDAR
jgi:hypothetical protein